jgi:hypothetical protein
LGREVAPPILLQLILTVEVGWRMIHMHHFVLFFTKV